jgi:hypothetical protein
VFYSPGVCIDLLALSLLPLKAMQTPPHYSVPARYMAPGTPPSMYLGAAPPQYAPSLYNGHAMPRYGIPQLSPGSGYQYGYGARLPMGSPYGPPVHMAGPPQYSAGPMIGGGKMTDVPAIFWYLYYVTTH